MVVVGVKVVEVSKLTVGVGVVLDFDLLFNVGSVGCAGGF